MVFCEEKLPPFAREDDVKTTLPASYVAARVVIKEGLIVPPRATANSERRRTRPASIADLPMLSFCILIIN